VRSSSAAHSSTWRLHSSIVFSGTIFIEIALRPRNYLISFYHTALIAQRAAPLAALFLGPVPIANSI
jgi:hypothetical protein